jgi:hypothetical protein
MKIVECITDHRDTMDQPKATNAEQPRHHPPELGVEQESNPCMASLYPAENESQHIVDPPQPLPSEANTCTSRWASIPGAWAMSPGGRGSLVRTSMLSTPTDDMDMEPINMEGLDRQNHGLVVANLVEDKSLQFALPEEDEQGTLDTARIRERKAKQCKTCILLSSLLFVAIVVVLVILVVSLLLRSPTSADKSQLESSSPSNAPTSLDGYILALFPADTVSAIEDEPNSPQSQAYQWLLADKGSLPDLSAERIKQRFALATLYFATNGDRWLTNSNWLSYSVHECDWYTKPEFGEKGSVAAYPGNLKEIFPASEPTPSICRDDGLFQHLWLDKNNLEGHLPVELYMLTSLKSLSLGSNRLQGTISSLVGQLTALEGLVINRLKNAGPVPTQVGILTNLRALVLDANDHQGLIPIELWQLTNLDTLSMATNDRLRGTIPSEIGAMASLRWINLSQCDISGELCF